MIDSVSLGHAFQAWTGRPSHGLAFAPGRVNLIGEHIDYHDRSVLPIALSRGLSVAFAPRSDGRVRARALSADGTAQGRYRDVEFGLDAIGPASEDGSWANYLKAAACFALAEWAQPRGADLLVMSDLPEAAGLSSSSALVVATTLALLHCLGRAPDLSDDAVRLRLATGLAEAERYVGTAGGGMDQAASMGGVAGHAILIDFAPLAWRAVPLPAGLRFVVADSGVRAEKSGEARARYNEIRAKASDPVIAEHIRSESERVMRFCEQLGSLPTGIQTDGPSLQNRLDEGYARLGRLLTRSHASLRDRLGVSHPALDHLVEIAIGAGALGARLTGAGFGGSIIAMCTDKKCDEVLRALSEHSAAFVAQPGGGASLTSGGLAPSS